MDLCGGGRNALVGWPSGLGCGLVLCYLILILILILRVVIGGAGWYRSDQEHPSFSVFVLYYDTLASEQRGYILDSCIFLKPSWNRYVLVYYIIFPPDLVIV